MLFREQRLHFPRDIQALCLRICRIRHIRNRGTDALSPQFLTCRREDKPFFHGMRIPAVQNKTERKFSKFIQKTKNEFKNMDNETRELLIDCILLSCTIAGIIGVAAYYIHQFIERIQNIFQ